MRLLLLVVLVALLTAGAGCGGVDTDEAADAPSPTAGVADRYRMAADAACTAHAHAVRALSTKPGIPVRFSDQGPYDTARADALRAQAEALGRLDPPADLRSAHDALASRASAYADAYAETARLATAQDELAWRASGVAHQRRGAAMLEAATALDLAACARRPSLAVAAAVRTVVGRVLLGRDPEGSCADDVTPAFLKSNLSGSEDACREVLAGLEAAGASLEFVETVGVDGITGVDGVLASANVRFTGSRDRPLRRFVYDLLWDGSRWRLDSALEHETGTAESSGAASS